MCKKMHAKPQREEMLTVVARLPDPPPHFPSTTPPHPTHLPSWQVNDNKCDLLPLSIPEFLTDARETACDRAAGELSQRSSVTRLGAVPAFPAFAAEVVG